MSNLEVKQGTAYHPHHFHHCCGSYQQHNGDDNVRARKVSESFEDEQWHEDEDKDTKDGVGSYTNGVVDDDDDMTEDEEVKRNCITGVSAMKDYDFFSSDDDLCGDDDDIDDDISDLDEDQEESLYQHKEKQQQEEEEENEISIKLVQFVGREQLQQRGTACTLVRPIPQIPPTTPSPQNDNEHMDEIDGSDGDDEQEDEEGNNEDVERDYDYCCENDGTPQDTNQQHIESDYITAVDDLDRSLSQIFPLKVGASGASVDDLCGPSKRKRVLSSNTLSTLSHEAGRNADHSPKRYRFPCSAADESPPTTTTVEFAFQMKLPPPPSLSLFTASSNMEMVTPDDTQALSQIQLMSRYSRELSSGDGGDCRDIMLRDELNAIPSDQPVYCSPDTSPVPLLTPPQSPRLGEPRFIDDDEQIKCVWPSNLVVDSAMMNIRQAMLRPLSAASLKGLECCDDDNDVCINESSDLADKKECEPLVLMPMFRSIPVGDDASSRR